MKKDKDYKKVLDSLQKDFGWADTKDMSYMEKDLVNDVIRAVKNLTTPVVTNPVKLNNEQPFTEEEAEIMQLLVRTHNKFIGLRNTHEMETTEWVQSFHKLQDLLGARVLRRDYPNTFHSI